MLVCHVRFLNPTMLGVISGCLIPAMWCVIPKYLTPTLLGCHTRVPPAMLGCHTWTHSSYRAGVSYQDSFSFCAGASYQGSWFLPCWCVIPGFLIPTALGCGFLTPTILWCHTRFPDSCHVSWSFQGAWLLLCWGFIQGLLIPIPDSYHAGLSYRGSWFLPWWGIMQGFLIPAMWGHRTRSLTPTMRGIIPGFLILTMLDIRPSVLIPTNLGCHTWVPGSRHVRIKPRSLIASVLEGQHWLYSLHVLEPGFQNAQTLNVITTLFVNG